MRITKSLIVTLVILAAALVPVLSFGMSRDVYTSPRKPKPSEPPSNNPPWTPTAPNGDVSVNLGKWNVIYIGIPNVYVKENKKKVTLKVTGAGAHKLHGYGAIGWYQPYGSTANLNCYGQGWSKPDKDPGPPESITWTITFDPQPDWEWICLRNYGSAQQFDINIEAEDECSYDGRIGTRLDSDASFGGPDDMRDYFRITEVGYFPEDREIDMGSVPTFNALPHTGNWTSSFQFVDPEGNPRPLGGVVWNSDGLGLEGGERYQSGFDMLGEADLKYSQYIFDAEAGTYHKFSLDFWPTTPWPVTRHDGECSGRGVATNGAMGNPDWVAPIPGGGVTHGGISILPDGRLVWKSYGPTDGVNDGRVYCFDPVTQIIVWDSIATAGLGTGQWAHGGVAVGRDGIYFGSRDGTYSVAKLDYDGNYMWNMAFPGPDINVRGTPLLNPNEDRLYVRDAGTSPAYLYCLDTNTGAMIWSFNMDAAMNGNGAYSSFGMLTGFGTGDEGDMFIYHTTNDADEDICVVDEGASASALWTCAEMNFSWHGSQAYSVDSLYCSTFGDGDRPTTYRVDPGTGEVLWSLRMGDGAANQFCRPAIGPDGTIYVGGHAGKMTAYMDDDTSGSIRWSYTSEGEFNNYVTVAGIPGDTWIYGIRSDSILYAFRDDGVQTDYNIAWTYQLGPGHYFGSFQATIDEEGGLYLAGGSGTDELGNYMLFHFPPYIAPEKPVIWDMERGSMKTTWQSNSATTYRVESSIDPYDYDETLMTWVTEASGIPGGDPTTTWEDLSAAVIGEKYYRVYAEDPSGDMSMDVKADETVGMIPVSILNGRNMMSIPFLPFPEGGGAAGTSTFDKIIGDQLTGHAVVKTLSDLIQQWNADTLTWTKIWLKVGTGWIDYDTGGAAMPFVPGRGYWVFRNGHPDTDVVLFGQVAKTDQVITVLASRNILGTPYPVDVALDDSGLVASGFNGHAVVKTLSDQILFWDAPTLSWKQFWYKVGVGFQPWTTGDPMKPFEPGDGFYLLRQGSTGFTWTYPVPN